MPIYMDLHILPGVKAKDVAEAHRRDMLIQNEHSCQCMTYWIDEKRGNVFCLIDAPDQQAVVEMHGKAHGLIPNKIIEVNSTLVESFLGRINDPEEAETTTDGLKIFSDSSFRILLLTKLADPLLLQYHLGREKAIELLNLHNEIIRSEFAAFNGSEVEHEGAGFIGSFASAAKAVACALTIQQKMSAAAIGIKGFKIGIHAGEAVSKNEHLFGDTLQLASRLCAVAGDFQVAVSSTVKELVSNDYFINKEQQVLSLPAQDEIWLDLLFAKLEENWQDADFNVSDYCQAMAMSQSQLYRKTVELTGLSPIILLKEFRLEKAKELMKKQRYSISQITFESGFSSPSYFTKCFKKKYNLLPLAYIELLH